MLKEASEDVRAVGVKLACAAGGVLFCSLAIAQALPLYAIPTEGVLPAERSARDGLVAELYSRDPVVLGEFLQVERSRIFKDRVDYSPAGSRPLKSAANRTWLESTFIVDFDESATRDLFEELMEEKGTSPTREHMIDFVAATIKGSLGRGWDPASIVARNRTGDCTEYAVLLTALSRAAGRPARVVTGLVVIATEAGPATYGHAWSEVEEAGTWQIADAALTAADVVGYIPVGILTNESSSYMLDLSPMMQVWVQRVRLK